jgi:hypothetical protein
MLPSCIAGRAQVLHFNIAVHQSIPKSRFLSLIQKAHLASTINAWLINASHRIFRQFPSLHRASEYAGEREEIAQDGCGAAPLVQTPCLPGLHALNSNGSERLRVPRSKKPM